MPRAILQKTHDGATSTGAVEVETLGHFLYTMQVVATSVTSGGTVLLQGSLDGTNYETIGTASVTGNGTTFVHSCGANGQTKYYSKVRANISARTDGTYNIWVACGGAGGNV